MINEDLKGVFNVNEFLAWSSIGRTQFYKEVNEGRLKVKKLGSRTLVPYESAKVWVDSLPDG